MITTTVPLREDPNAVYLEAYVLKNSLEFQSGNKRPAVIICPGGAYLRTSDREAEPVALHFLARGYHAFVLRYSVQTRFPQPMLDLATAIRTVRQNTDEWFVDGDQIVVCGFSAGGHLAASLGVHWDKPFIYEPLQASADQIKPNALILGYPVIDLELLANPPIALDPEAEPVGLNEHVLATVLGEFPPPRALVEQYRLDHHVSSATPPTFLWHTADDQLVFAQNALRFATALAGHHVPYELHIFESGVHGLSLADETTDEQGQFLNEDCQIWIDLALKWLERQRTRRVYEPIEPSQPRP
jgi:acetyl esterase/lipase